MAVKTRQEILNKINEIVGEENNDDVLSLIEDVTDTMNDYDSRVGTADEWKEKYETNDAEWRQKYKERFMSGDTSSESNPVGEVDSGTGDFTPDETVVAYEDLFSKGV